ncbi:amidohydrolase family protein [Streptomyces sp. NPDC058321]|uniref:metal-dependent hydrolase family protein n=1 Tax=Streptomyces sp. NPDC058321 TaxID=3346445 RepID=UPI0036EC9ECB
MAKTVIRNARLIDGTGADPVTAEIVVDGQRIVQVATTGGVSPEHADATAVDAGGRTVMPGLIDAHSHPSFLPEIDLAVMGNLPVEEHTLLTARNVRLMLDQGFTSIFCAASAKPRLDLVIRNEINAGNLVGPRMLVASPELTVTGGVGDVRLPHLDRHSVEHICDGPDEFRKVSRWYMREGVDHIKLDISGDEFIPYAKGRMTTMTDEEVAVVADVAHSRGKRLAAHARSAESVKMCVRHGVEIIYHADFMDAEGLDMVTENMDKHFVAPALGFVHTSRYEAKDWGLTPEVTASLGLDAQMDLVISNMIELKKRGVRVLPGGDYFVPWNPMGANARDLEHFVNYLGFTPMEAIESATRLGGELMLQGDELGCIKEGYLADLLIVDSDPLNDISVLQKQESFVGIMKDGVWHRKPAGA